MEVDDEEDASEFSMINLDLHDLDCEDSDGVSNAVKINDLLQSTIIDNLLFSNEQLYELRSQLNGHFNNAVCSSLQISWKE